MRTRPHNTTRLSALCQRWSFCTDPSEAGQLHARIQRILRVANAINQAAAERVGRQRRAV